MRCTREWSRVWVISLAGTHHIKAGVAGVGPVGNRLLDDAGDEVVRGMSARGRVVEA
jgi:hypothetical protein